MGGLTRLPYSEIKAWADGTGTILTPDEYLILRRLSGNFCAGANDTDPDSPPPFEREITEEEGKEMQRKMREARARRRNPSK